MKKLSFLLLSLVLLAGCASGSNDSSANTNEGSSQDTTVYENDFNYVYQSDMTSFDYLTNNKSANGDHYNNWVEGLITQDPYGNLVPGMAESWESNEDATEWTFTIRSNAKWVTNNQEEYEDVTAQDFVTALQHAADFKSDTLWLVGDLIEGLNNYVNGSATWDEVGVKADGNTLTYKLTKSAPYFDSMTVYSILYPVNQEFLESNGEGCKLGSPNPETCKFGSVDPTSILYNSAYTLSNYTSKSVIEYEKNELYWDVANVHVPHVKLVYNDGSDPDFLFKMFTNGDVSAAAVNQTNPAVVEQAKKEYGDNLYLTSTGSTSFYATFNFNRKAYSSFADPSKAVSVKTDAQKADTKEAILNKNFRLAVFAAFSDAAFGAQSKGEDLALSAARNTFTAPTFVKTSDGKLYGKLVDEKLQKLEPEVFGGVSLDDGIDAYYSPEKAKTLIEKAVEELGDSVSSWPVYLDVPVDESSDLQVRRAQAIKSSIEEAIGDYVQLNLVLSDQDTYYNSWYYASTGADANFDFVFNGGWGPDYADPRSYLNILLPENGDMLTLSGLSLGEQNIEGDKEIKEAIGLVEYGKLAAEADAIVDDNDTRFDKFADAEAYLLANGIIRPFSTTGGNFAISRVIPFTQAYGLYGAASYNLTPKFKYMQVGNDVITTEQHATAKEAWLSQMAD